MATGRTTCELVYTRRIAALPCREFSESYPRQKKSRFPLGIDNEAREGADNEEEGSGEQEKETGSEQREQAIYLFRKEKHAGQPRAAPYLPWSATSEQTGNRFSLPAACLPVSTLTAGTHPATPRPQAPQRQRRKPVPSPSHPEERNVAWQQISQALKLHRHLQGIAPTWRVDDPRPSAFRIMAKLEELERATRPMCRWDH